MSYFFYKKKTKVGGNEVTKLTLKLFGTIYIMIMMMQCELDSTWTNDPTTRIQVGKSKRITHTYI